MSSHSLAAALAIVSVAFLIAGWNGIYNLDKIASGVEAIGGSTFTASHTHRSLTYLSISGALMVASMLINALGAFQDKRSRKLAKSNTANA